MKLKINGLGLSDEVASLLHARGFQIEDCSGPDKEAFGNMVLILASSSSKLRLATDRGDMLVDACPPQQETWVSFFQLVRETNPEIYDEPNLRFRVPVNDIFIAALTTGWQRLQRLLSLECFEETRSRLAARSREEFPRRLKANGFSEEAIQQLLRASDAKIAGC